MILDRLKVNNPSIQFLTSDDCSPLFNKVEGDFSDYIKESGRFVPEERNVYIADDADLLTSQSVKKVWNSVFAEMPVQAGWCYGKNKYMNGMEWHKSSEIVIACTDCVMLLGSYSDIENEVFNSVKAIGLYLEKGQAVELMPMTLHLAPLPVNGYFIVGIILPKGTNSPLSGGIAGTRRAVNKWLLIHKDNQRGIELGGKIGVIGDNISLKE